MRKKLIAGNWKMNLGSVMAERFTREIKDRIDTDRVDVVMCVPYIHLSMIKSILDGTNIKLGAQNMHYADEGAYTGEISGRMLSALGVQYVIVGHSERREYFRETDTEVNLKALKALQNRLTPIVCVGETAKQRKSGRAPTVIAKQMNFAMDEMTAEDITRTVFAYEPIWAIGTGASATAEQAEEVCAAIRRQINSRYGVWAADNVRILYGGSVTEVNAKEIFRMPNIDGGLVGGVSIKEGFEYVVHYDR